MLRTKFSNGWTATMLVDHGRRPIHDHSVPKGQRPRRQRKVPAYNPNDGSPILDEAGNQIMIPAKRIKLDAHGQKVFKDGCPVLEEWMHRPAPRQTPECTVCTILLEDPDGDAHAFTGWTWLHWRDRKRFSRKIGARIAKSRALAGMHISMVPEEMKMAVVAWLRGLPSETISELMSGSNGSGVPEQRAPEPIHDEIAGEDNHRAAHEMTVETKPTARVVGARTVKS